MKQTNKKRGEEKNHKFISSGTPLSCPACEAVRQANQFQTNGSVIPPVFTCWEHTPKIRTATNTSDL